jgi:hypothetical protein
MIITVNIAGHQQVVDTEEFGNATTTGALFGNSTFQEDFSVPDRASPTMNGQVVDGVTPLNENGVFGFIVAASSKS